MGHDRAHRWAGVGREFSAVVFGIASADHPINDEIFDALHAAGEKHGVDISAGSVPYFEHGNELDRKLAEVTAERDLLRTAIAEAVTRLTPSDQPISEQLLDTLTHGGRSQARAAGGVGEVRQLLSEALEDPRG